MKADKGEYRSLLEKPFFQQKVAEERDFQKRVNADPKLKAEYGGLWAEIAKADRSARQLYLPYVYLEGVLGFESDLYTHARRLVRMAAEFSKPNSERLPLYTDARKPELQQATLSKAPIYPELEIEKLTFSLSKLREALGPDDPPVRQIFRERSPREIATDAVKGSKLTDVAVRKALMEGGQPAIDASDDPMIKLAKQVDPIARKIRKQWEDEVESARTRALEKLGAARFAVYGTSLYPDATFTLRLSYGALKGWTENGKPVHPFTTLGGAFDRATGREPFALAPSWLEAKPRLNMQTPSNFVTTNDIIGGNSGSPVINKDAQLVGLIFDGNIHSLGGNDGFDETLNRAVRTEWSQSVRLSHGVAEALRGAETEAFGMDALELPRDAGRDSPRRQPRNMMNPSWPKRIDCGQGGQGGRTFRNARKKGPSELKISKHFRPGTEAGENVPWVRQAMIHRSTVVQDSIPSFRLTSDTRRRTLYEECRHETKKSGPCCSRAHSTC